MTDNISITIDFELLERLDNFTKKFKRQRVRSLIISEAIKEYLDRHEKDEKKLTQILKDEK